MSDFKPVVIINEYLVLQACLGFMEDFIVILPDVKKNRGCQASPKELIKKLALMASFFVSLTDTTR